MFTRNAHVTSPPIDSRGPDDLADQVLLAVAGAVASQHLLGTIEIHPLGSGRTAGRAKAAVRAYVQATVILDVGGLLRVLATYDDVAVRTRDGWRLASSAATTLHVEIVAS